MEDANKFMGNVLRELARKRPELADGSGRAFWPVSLYFPTFLAKTTYDLQEKITSLYWQGSYADAKLLTEIRTDLSTLTHVGDIGEDHSDIYLQDHPDVRNLSKEEVEALPFYHFCKKIGEVDNPIVALGVMGRNEEGSIGEIEALVETKLIADGKFAEVHSVEEVVHTEIAAGIRKKLLDHPTYRADFQKGWELHDQVYRTILR